MAHDGHGPSNTPKTKISGHIGLGSSSLGHWYTFPASLNLHIHVLPQHSGWWRSVFLEAKEGY
ncbi:hypothetical protein RSAG8_13094, partial [Rhizoctonia solani AG-8 WAC10335]